MSKRTNRSAVILLVLSGAILLLGACHTIAGAGEDVSQTGRVIEKSADKHAP